MAKKRFGLLGKIILLTGLLTVSTVSASLAISSGITYANNKKTFVSDCAQATNNIEAIFSNNKENTSEIVTIICNRYFDVRDDFDNLSQEQLNDYQHNLRLDLFEPEPGSMGMDLHKALRKAFYSESLASIQQLCATYQIPYSSLGLYDLKTGRLINILNSDIEMEENLSSVGLAATDIDEYDREFCKSNENAKTVTTKDKLFSYHIVNVPLIDDDFKLLIRGEYSFAEFQKEFSKQILTELLITFGSAIVLVVIYALLAKLFVLKNVKRLMVSTDQFVDKMKNEEKLEIVDANVTTHDEIKDLSDKFNVMQEQIINYVDRIKKAKDKEQAMDAEINVASKIQLESLPAQTFFVKELELRAFIKPAKGVGGDFYDYFFIDEDHLAVTIADVSGKGIPASLFMMRSKESIQSVSKGEKDLAKVFHVVNNSLCMNNKEGFFVTCFLGVLDLKTKEFNYVSAGHERPFIRRNGKWERLEAESNFVLGIEEDFEYKSQKIKLQKGDAIVLYTDGLNEAINSDKEEFGYERIKDSLSKVNEAKNIIPGAISDLETFIGKEEQFDDITMLAFEIKKDAVSFSYLNPTYDDITDLTEKVNKALSHIDENTLSKIGVVIDEAMNNIISYGQTKAYKTLEVIIEKDKDSSTLIFIDNSHPFNPLLKEKRTVQENMEQGIVGGLGISIIKSISKETEYVYANNKNILRIKF